MTEGLRQERKVVTVLFADLVGFTSQAERMDPEDVAALLRPYHARLRSELERHGGTVEKFIGDAVMAVFGAPTVHEDDPERAVRAALAIRDSIREDGKLDVRIAVNTGEALVSLGVRPELGEGMVAGDVVNTAARMQTAAPINSVLVGGQTFRATREAIEYREAQPVEAKGKAEPVPVWEALQARARLGVDLAAPPQTPLIGRRRELDLVLGAFERARQMLEPQLVTLVGVPGIGKSRLVAELLAVVEADPELIAWRQGRSLPYGEGVSFWALAEMVKAQAGVLETDALEDAARKLADAVGALGLDAGDAAWVEAHLRPLLGLAVEADAGGDRRAESFTAWTRFFEALGDRGPVVLVFEDLHWADDGLLDFVDHLVDWARESPLLVVCTARPELLEHRPAWGGGKPNAVTVSLPPLTDEETARLLGELLGRPLLSADTQVALLARAGGNPLYAEQYVRMLDERGAMSDEVLPETIQGLIAARLDALQLREKELLQDAAVLGKVFWLGGLTAIGGGERDDAARLLHGLERKEFVRRARRSSLAEESEFSFRHLLVRDVAYGQIPRAARAEKHRLAAAWIESLGRREDHAEMLAHHYLSALELGRATGQEVDDQLSEHARLALREAGDRAFALNAYAVAPRFYEAALELAAPSSAEHATLLFLLGRARFAATMEADVELLAQASTALEAAGEVETAAEAELLLCDVEWQRGLRDRAFEHLHRARSLVAGAPLSHVKARVTTSVSRFLMLASEDEEALRAGRAALQMAESLSLADVRASALNNIGTSRVNCGDPGGVADLERAVEVAAGGGSGFELCRAQGNLAAVLWELGDIARSNQVHDGLIRSANRIGEATFIRWASGQSSRIAYHLGRWDESLELANDFLAAVEEGSPHYLAPEVYHVRSQIRLARADERAAIADAERAVQLVRAAKDPQIVYQVLAGAAHAYLEAGERGRAEPLAGEVLDAVVARRRLGFAVVGLHLLSWTVEAIGRAAELAAALRGRQAFLWADAARSYASGDPLGAADVCARIGSLPEEAYDRLRAAEAFAAAGRAAEAETQARRALVFYRSVGARRYIVEAESLLAASESA